MEGFLSIIGLGSFVGMALGCMIGFDHDFGASTQKKMLRLATVSIFTFISWFVVVSLYTVGVIQ